MEARRRGSGQRGLGATALATAGRADLGWVEGRRVEARRRGSGQRGLGAAPLATAGRADLGWVPEGGGQEAHGHGSATYHKACSLLLNSRLARLLEGHMLQRLCACLKGICCRGCAPA